MNRQHHKSISLTAAAILLAAAAAPGWADDTQYQQLEQTGVSLTEAIKTAEAHVDGKAYEAEFEKDSFSPEYEIDVLTASKRFEITVDAMTGEVTQSRSKDK